MSAQDGDGLRADGAAAPFSALRWSPLRPFTATDETHSRRLTKLSTSSPQGDVLVTYACSSCVFSVSPLRFDAQPTADGGLTKLRVWATSRHTCVLRAA